VLCLSVLIIDRMLGGSSYTCSHAGSLHHADAPPGQTIRKYQSVGLSAHCTHDEIARIAIADGYRQTGVAKLVNNAVAAAGRQSMLTTSSYYYYCDAVSPSAETGT
jgi:hypothetical protein